MEAITKKLKILYHYCIRKYKLNFKDKEALKKYQNKEIKKQLNFVVNNSKFYKDLYSGIDINNIENLNKLPIIDKKQMMDNFDDFNTVGLKGDEALEIAFKAEQTRDFSPVLKGVTIGLSSGTSGNRGLFIASKNEEAMWAGSILAKCLPKSILSNYKIAFFLRANSNLYESVKSRNIQFEFFDLLKPVEEHVETLNEFKPSVLIAPASMLVLLGKAIENKSLIINPIKVYSVAEILEDIDKKYLEKIFNQKIHQIYQATEGVIATSCDCGILHVNEDVMLVEKEYIDENRFYPIITDFTRKSQPIIRYRLNDILVEKKQCECGSPFMALERVEGRSDDIFWIEASSGNKNIELFPDFIRRIIMMSSHKVSSYGAIQIDIKNVDIYLEFNKGATDKEIIEAKEFIESELENLVLKKGGKPYKIKFKGEYILNKGDKLRRIKSNL